jgi:flagellar assembly protein FliH
MSSRIIRSNEASKKARVSSGGMGGPTDDGLASDHVMTVEKQAFEQGYKEGERIGKQMGERMVENTIKRYERTVQQLAGVHRTLTEAMETETVRLSMEIARKIIQRETTIDEDLVAALVSVAMKRVHGHHGIEVRVSSHDYNRVCDAIRSANGSIPVKEDSSLERGDFILDTVETHLDGRISSQIDAVGRALFDE